MTNGILVINKPRGITSHDVVSFIRRKFKMKRVGHAGTLDPLATGVLIILLGESTKLFNSFSGFDKAYEATLRLGMVTDTADICGKVLYQNSWEDVRESQIEEAFQKFLGSIDQMPPMYSAVKVGGERLYKLARKGLVVPREARRIEIKALKLLNFSSPEVQFYVECSKGTYIRKLAEDIGEVLGCGGCISQINRVRVGPFSIEESFPLEEINESHIRHWKI